MRGKLGISESVAAVPAQRSYPYRILIADDDPAVLDAYREVLDPPKPTNDMDDLEAELFGATPSHATEHRFDVVYCRQGDEAVEAARRAQEEGRPFAVAFLDVRMPPGPNGVDAAEQIRRFDQDLQIVFVTGFSDVQPQEMWERLLPADRLFYVAKPFQPPELLQFARTLTNKWQTEKELEQARAELERQHRALQERERLLQEQNRRIDAALDNMSQGLCLFDADQRLVICNQRFLEIYRLSPKEVPPGITVQEVVERMTAAANYRPEEMEHVLAAHLTLASEGAYKRHREELWDGRIIGIVHNPMPDGRFVNTYEDMTQLQRAEDRIHYLAHHDVLTGLPNRAYFHERLEQELTRVQRREEMAAVLCLDLDHFKAVNDTLGHPIGDALLVAAAQRLREVVRDTDTIARLGGDEFAIIQTDVGQPEAAAALARRLIEALAAPYDLNGHQVVVGVSIGISVAPVDGVDVADLVRNADLALYRAKVDGRAVYRFFEAEMDARMQQRRRLEMELRSAVAAGDMVLYYQPLVDIRSQKRVAGFEALVRWRHPERGLVSPVEFIPIAEETGLITQLGAWIIRRACADAASWPNPVRVAINLSALQFKRGDLVQTVVDALAESGLAAGRLELEITESVLLANSSRTLDTLHRLREMGVRICMDDFGTGYGSLGYLRSFPFDKIKIDRSFISDIGKTRDAEIIIETVNRLAVGLGMDATGEGVETELQLDYLRAISCFEVQGYYFSKPRPVEHVADMLAFQVAAEVDDYRPSERSDEMRDLPAPVE